MFPNQYILIEYIISSTLFNTNYYRKIIHLFNLINTFYELFRLIHICDKSKNIKQQIHLQKGKIMQFNIFIPKKQKIWKIVLGKGCYNKKWVYQHSGATHKLLNPDWPPSLPINTHAHIHKVSLPLSLALNNLYCKTHLIIYIVDAKDLLILLLFFQKLSLLKKCLNSPFL